MSSAAGRKPLGGAVRLSFADEDDAPEESSGISAPSALKFRVTQNRSAVAESVNVNTDAIGSVQKKPARKRMRMSFDEDVEEDAFPTVPLAVPLTMSPLRVDAEIVTPKMTIRRAPMTVEDPNLPLENSGYSKAALAALKNAQLLRPVEQAPDVAPSNTKTILTGEDAFKHTEELITSSYPEEEESPDFLAFTPYGADREALRLAKEDAQNLRVRRSVDDSRMFFTCNGTDAATFGETVSPLTALRTHKQETDVLETPVVDKSVGSMDVWEEELLRRGTATYTRASTTKRSMDLMSAMTELDGVELSELIVTATHGIEQRETAIDKLRRHIHRLTAEQQSLQNGNTTSLQPKIDRLANLKLVQTTLPVVVGMLREKEENIKMALSSLLDHIKQLSTQRDTWLRLRQETSCFRLQQVGELVSIGSAFHPQTLLFSEPEKHVQFSQPGMAKEEVTVAFAVESMASWQQEAFSKFTNSSAVAGVEWRGTLEEYSRALSVGNYSVAFPDDTSWRVVSEFISSFETHCSYFASHPSLDSKFLPFSSLAKTLDDVEPSVYSLSELLSTFNQLREASPNDYCDAYMSRSLVQLLEPLVQTRLSSLVEFLAVPTNEFSVIESIEQIFGDWLQPICQFASAGLTEVVRKSDQEIVPLLLRGVVWSTVLQTISSASVFLQSTGTERIVAVASHIQENCSLFASTSDSLFSYVCTQFLHQAALCEQETCLLANCRLSVLSYDLSTNTDATYVASRGLGRSVVWQQMVRWTNLFRSAELLTTLASNEDLHSETGPIIALRKWHQDSFIILRPTIGKLLRTQQTNCVEAVSGTLTAWLDAKKRLGGINSVCVDVLSVALASNDCSQIWAAVETCS